MRRRVTVAGVGSRVEPVQHGDDAQERGERCDEQLAADGRVPQPVGPHPRRRRRQTADTQQLEHAAQQQVHVGQLEHSEDRQPQHDEETVPLANVPQQCPQSTQDAAVDDTQVKDTRRVDDDQTQQEHVIHLRVDTSQEQRHGVGVEVLAAVRPVRVVALRRYDLIPRRPADVQFLCDAATRATFCVHHAKLCAPSEPDAEHGEEHRGNRHLREQNDAQLRLCIRVIVVVVVFVAEAKPFCDELFESVDFLDARGQVPVDPVEDSGHAGGATVAVQHHAVLGLVSSRESEHQTGTVPGLVVTQPTDTAWTHDDRHLHYNLQTQHGHMMTCTYITTYRHNMDT